MKTIAIEKKAGKKCTQMLRCVDVAMSDGGGGVGYGWLLGYGWFLFASFALSLSFTFSLFYRKI